MQKTVTIKATKGWKLEEILEALIKGEGWKGFMGDMNSIAGKVKVTITVNRI